MNYIQTLYIDSHKDPFNHSFGWAAPEYHLMGWALSCLQLNKIYGKTTLYANTQAAHLLIDTIQLPYTELDLQHEKYKLIHPDLWALPKIYTYSLQEQPFLHIDGDVFLFKPFDPQLLKGELIAQNVERATEQHYIPFQKNLMRHLTFFPPCVKKDFDSGTPFLSCNAGILGGNHLGFFHDYAASAFEYVTKNADKLKHINIDMFNVFVEQHLFYAAAKEKSLAVSVLFDEIVNDNGYKNLGDFHDVPFNRSYLHLLGPFKRDEFTCIQMSAKLRELYPDYYERIVALFRKKNILLSPYGFVNECRPKSGINIQANTYLQWLQNTMNHCPSEIDSELFRNDFEIFHKRLTSFLTQNNTADLSARDSVAQQWYRHLFVEPSTMLHQTIVRCPETDIILSSFDFSGLWNKYYRAGIDYYTDLKITKGQFFNLIVAEATDIGFSFYDINELDYLLLQLLSESLSINDILSKMQIHIEDDFLRYNYETYQNLVISSIKQLVIKKAIQPQLQESCMEI